MYQTVRNLIDDGFPTDKIWWIRLDHPLLMNVPLGNLVEEVVKNGSARGEPVLFLDELAYAKDWDKWLKSFYDDNLPVKIVATSSAASALKKKSESGVGRWNEHLLAPYLLGEYLDLAGLSADIKPSENLRLTVESVLSGSIFDVMAKQMKSSRRKLLLSGGFPELLSNNLGGGESDFVLKSQRTLRLDAVERAIYKDIPQSFGIDNPMLLERLLYTLTGNIAGVLSPSNIMSDLGMSQPTFERYVSYLERAFLIFTLTNYSGSENKVQRRGRKLYFVDGAVRNAALYRGLSLLENVDELGLLLENMVATHLRALSFQTVFQLYYWRDGRNEVDFIYDHPEKPLAFEIASSERHSLRGLLKLMDKHPKFKGGCYLVYPDALRVNPLDSKNGIGSIPFDLFLVCISKQVEKALGDKFVV